MLAPGDAVPDATVWTGPGEGPRRLREVLGDGAVLLAFYLFDWSPTWTNELLLLRDRGDDLAAACIRPFAISRDSVWSHAAWARSLGVEDIPLLSDWDGEATRAFGVAVESRGMHDVPARTAFLIEDGTIRRVWELGGELPDVDAVIAAARA
jgi:glutaredoxin-dependent peroxiredoxin